jgi:hypothetical protein
MVEHVIRETGSFIAGNLVYTADITRLGDFLENGLPKAERKRVFGNPNSADVIRVGMLTKRPRFEERIKFGSCLLPRFDQKKGNNSVGIALDTQRLLEDSRFRLQAVGLGFQEEALESLFGIQHRRSQFGLPIDTSPDAAGLLDEVHILLLNEPRVDPQFIRGVLVKDIKAGLFPLIDRFRKIPFFNREGTLLR